MERELHPIEKYTQETSWSCGAGAMVIAYRRLGIYLNEMSLARELETNPESGTEMSNMYQHATNYGFPAEMKSWGTYKDLQRDSKRGVVIVGFTPFWSGEPGGHYAVLTTILDDMVELSDPGLQPEDQPNIMSKKEFMSKWFAEGYPSSYLLIRPKQ